MADKKGVKDGGVKGRSAALASVSMAEGMQTKNPTQGQDILHEDCPPLRLKALLNYKKDGAK